MVLVASGAYAIPGTSAGALDTIAIKPVSHAGTAGATAPPPASQTQEASGLLLLSGGLFLASGLISRRK
jgi:hypothetical protein